MISGLRGFVAAKNEDSVIINVNGVCYEALMSGASVAKVPATPKEIYLWTRLISTDNAINLYGFLSEQDRKMFDLLLTVNGVGPKVALNILGAAPLEKIAAGISQERPELFPKVTRLGPKTIKRVILELKNKIQDIVPKHSNISTSDVPAAQNDLAMQALTDLGYSTAEAADALAQVKSQDLSKRVKEALQNLSSKVVAGN